MSFTLEHSCYNLHTNKLVIGSCTIHIKCRFPTFCQIRFPIFCCIPLILVELRRPGAIKQKFKKISSHCVLIIYCNVADTIMLHVKSYILQVQYDWVVCENINDPSPCDSSLVLNLDKRFQSLETLQFIFSGLN